jgi:N-acetylglutamate synthase-like GNAT family acetyltransferase
MRTWKGKRDMVEDRVPEIRVRRTRPSDTPRIADFLNRALRRGQFVSPESVVAYLGKAGLLLAEADGELVGLLGWRVENLVARVVDFLILPARFLLPAGGALLPAMEETAYELQCEVALILMPSGARPEERAFWEKFGYGLHEIATLPKPWQGAAREAGLDAEDQVMLKQLRQSRVVRPL